MIIYVYIYIYIFHSFNYSNTYLDHRISARELVPKNKLSLFISSRKSFTLSYMSVFFRLLLCYFFFFWTSHRSNLKKRFKYNKEYTCYEAEADYKKEIDY